MFHQFFSGVGQVFAGIASLVVPRRLLDKLRKRSSERAASRVTSESRVGKTVERMEDRFHLFLQGIGSVFDFIFKLFVPTKLIQSTEKVVTKKTATVFWDVRYRLKKFGERIAPKWLTQRVGKLYDAFAMFLRFCKAWTFSRDYVALAWSLPAILMALPICLSLIGSVVYSSQDKIRHYNAKLATAIEERDEDTEKLCFEKLTQLGSQRTEKAIYASAVSLADEGNWEKAIARMQEIAPLEEGHFPPAHLWLATQIANGKMTVDDPWKVFETHAKHAKARSIGHYRGVHDTARRFIIETDLHYGRTEMAMAEMKSLVKKFPELHAALMDQSLKQRDRFDAVKHARHVIDLFSARVTARSTVAGGGNDAERPTGPRTPDAKDPLTTQEYLQWMTATKLVRNTQDLARIVRSARARYPDDEALFETLITQMGSYAASVPFSDSQLVPLLKDMLQLSPNHRVAILKLTSGVLEGSPAAKACLDTLEAEGSLPVEVLVRLGDVSASEDRDAAVDYYQRACRLDPGQMRAWNNLAYVLGQLGPGDEKSLQRALQASNKAIELGGDPRSFETRGQILVKLKRWSEAIPDLEQSLNGTLPNAGPTHRALAKAYSAVGNKEAAVAHERLAVRSEQ